jgi:hypothetical protein
MEPIAYVETIDSTVRLVFEEPDGGQYVIDEDGEVSTARNRPSFHSRPETFFGHAIETLLETDRPISLSRI